MNPVVCTALDQCHDAGTCDTGTGLCSDPAKDDGTPCDDSDESTLNDACTSGVCAGNPVEPLPLRADFTTGIFHASTDQTLTDNQFGTAATALTVVADGSGDASADFYSAPLTAAGPALTAADSGAATIWVGNAGASDITVTCAATFADYDAATGTETEIVTTGASANKTVLAGDAVFCVTPSGPLAADVTVPSDHLLKLTITLHFVTGSSAQIHYNAAFGDPGDSASYLPANRAASWPFGDFTACGNGTVEPGEECDQGTANGTAGSCCTSACLFKAADTVCRPAVDQCDADETCTGASATCPADLKQADDTPCDDTDACTQTDTCQAGICVGMNPVVCTALDQCHDAGTCDPGTGLCSNPAAGNGTPCDDGNACTTHDTCSGGSCVGGPPPDCDDHNVCTDDSCNPANGECAHTNNTVPCDDDNLCTHDDVCQDGSCAGQPVVCDDGIFCNGFETCDFATGGCNAGTPPTCDDAVVCTHDDCAPDTDACSNTPIASCCSSNANCDNHNACTGAETCDVATGQCQSGTALHCDDGNPCNGVETCDPVAGCQNGTQPDCDDGLVCTGDYCDPASGCVNPPIPNCCVTDGDCDNHDICDGLERCESNSCVNGT